MKIHDDIKKYLKIDSIVIFDDKKVFTIEENDSINNFYKAIANFNELISHTYIKNGILLYSINDYLLTFEYKFSEVKRLYDYSVDHQLKNVQNYLGDFLLAFQYSIESNMYKKSNIYSKLSKEFYLKFSRKEFYNNGNYVNDSLNYLMDLMAFNSSSFDTSFYFDSLQKLFDKAKDDERYHKIFECLLNEGKMFSKLYDLDFNVKTHTEQFNEYIQKSCEEFANNQYKFESSLKLLLKLSKENILIEKSYIMVLNCLITEINKIINELYANINNSVSFIANIESIILALITIKKCKNFSVKYGTKIEECIRIILFCKRSYVKSDNINDGMVAVEHEFEIEHSMFEKMEKDLLNSLQNIFVYLRVDFDSMLESSLKSFSDNPLIDLVSHVSINTELGTYYCWDEISHTSFSLYYNKKGNQITKSKGKQLINKYTGDFYLLMLKHMSMTSTMAGQIMYSRFSEVLNKKLRPYIFEKILNTSGDFYKNDYILCTNLILCIEQLIHEQFLRTGIELIEGKTSKKLEKLFQYYIEDRLSRDVYMLVNHTLYNEFGLEYRNNFVHGNFMHKADLTVELLYIFSCVVGLIVVGNENEKK